MKSAAPAKPSRRKKGLKKPWFREAKKTALDESGAVAAQTLIT